MEEKKKSGFLLFLIAFMCGCGIMYAAISAFPSLFSTSTTKVVKDVTITENGIADAVDKIYDSVVIVSTYKDDKLFSTGTGFVYKKDNSKGYILTNNHVISGGNKVSVTFTNGNVVDTEIVGSNTLSDIAVLTVPEKEVLQVAEIGDSEELRVGDTSFAVGAPLDSVYSWTVTRGIVSGKNRMVEVTLASNSGDYVMKVLQTDAAINSGNSGGPLCNSNGEVIGITSLKLVDTSVEGMGFAIPIETALQYAEKIINKESNVLPYLGVSMVNLADAYNSIQYYSVVEKANVKSGAFVVTVEEGSPAGNAGLQEGDIITKLNDKDVTSVAYLRYYLYDYSVGDKINLSFIRDGKEKTVSVTLSSNNKTY